MSMEYNEKAKGSGKGTNRNNEDGLRLLALVLLFEPIERKIFLPANQCFDFLC